MSAHLARVLPSLDAVRARHPDYFEDESAPRAAALAALAKEQR